MKFILNIQDVSVPGDRILSLFYNSGEYLHSSAYSGTNPNVCYDVNGVTLSMIKNWIFVYQSYNGALN